VSELAVTAFGADRPGIVAAVAAVLRDRGGNVEDSAMTILGGHFAIMLLVETDDSAADLRTALDAATSAFDLTISVAPAGAGQDSAAPTHVLSVYGGDRPGILAGVSRALADVGANITDLETRLLSADDDPIYAMVVELSLAGDSDDQAVTDAVAAVATELGVDHTLRALDAETY
jgi:glycine cleavage system transcriptional repressor